MIITKELHQKWNPDNKLKMFYYVKFGKYYIMSFNFSDNINYPFLSFQRNHIIKVYGKPVKNLCL